MSDKECLERLRQQLTQQLPPLVLRHKLKKHVGDLFSDSYMAKLDSIGGGPKRVRIGRKSAYIREDFIDWLIQRMEVQP